MLGSYLGVHTVLEQAFEIYIRFGFEIPCYRLISALYRLFSTVQIERKTIIVSKYSRLKCNELWFMVPFLLKLMFEIIFSTCFIVIDHLVYIVLSSVAKNGNVTYNLEGENVVQIEVRIIIRN